jgi:hypothetical protein
VGLFSIFKKTDALAPLSDDDAARLAANSEAERASQQARQREIARATAMKIDAIESAMTFDIFNQPEPAWGSQRASRPTRVRQSAEGGPDTQALTDLPTTLLLRDDEIPQPAVAAESAPVVEEIAILYANAQSAVAQQLLTAAVADSGSKGSGQDRSIWWMLFDLYQVSGQQDASTTCRSTTPAPSKPRRRHGTRQPCWRPRRRTGPA